MRTLNQLEINRLKFLTSNDIEVALIEPTETGLKKSIMDATQTVRYYLKSKGIHDYETQKQGPDYKLRIETRILTDSAVVTTCSSLYRPVSKTGDPRIWIIGIARYCKPNDILAIIATNGRLNIFNLSSIDIISLSQGPIFELITGLSEKSAETSKELLLLMRKIASKGFIQCDFRGDTAVGRLLEYELGIPINSSTKPDYKGIEIKSFRGGRNNRKGLFAQVPNWNLSKLKSSKEILDHFGYDREGIRKLNCTVNTLTFNSQGLRLKLMDEPEWLVEYSSTEGEIVVWEMEKLRQRLIEKHSETFWVEAQTRREGNKEFMKFVKVEHTKEPIASQFSIVLSQGKINLDHVIKEKGNSAVEKGPLFKLEHNSLGLLFPPSKTYDLL